MERLPPTTLGPRSRFPERRGFLQQAGRTPNCHRLRLPRGLGGWNDRPLPNADGRGGQEDGRLDAPGLHHLQHARGQPLPRYLQKVRSPLFRAFVSRFFFVILFSYFLFVKSGLFATTLLFLYMHAPLFSPPPFWRVFDPWFHCSVSYLPLRSFFSLYLFFHDVLFLSCSFLCVFVSLLLRPFVPLSLCPPFPCMTNVCVRAVGLVGVVMGW